MKANFLIIFHVTWMLSVMILAAQWSPLATLSLEAKCLWFPTVQWPPSQARPQETGLSALWAKMVTKVLFKLPSSGVKSCKVLLIRLFLLLNVDSS